MENNQPHKVVIDLATARTGDPKARQARDLAIQAVNLYAERFMVVVDDNQVPSCTCIASPRILHPIRNMAVVEQMARDFGNQMTFSALKRDVFPMWIAMCQANRQRWIRFTDITPLVFLSDTETPWAWQRLPFDAAPNTPCPPIFQRMLDRATEDEGYSLKLWLGSLFDFKFPRKQYLYLHGDGNDGKSTLVKMLTQQLGQQGVAWLRSQNFKQPHSTTLLEGARLAVFGDEDSDNFMSKGDFKCLTGDDTFVINQKGQPLHNTQLHCKVMIATNNPPYIKGGPADEGRIVPVRLQSIQQVSFSEGQSFLDAGTAIMQYCYSEYSAWRAANPDAVAIPTSLDAMTAVISNSGQAALNERLKRMLTFGEDYEIDAGELCFALQSQFGSEYERVRQDVYKILRSTCRQSYVRSPSGQGRNLVWKGVRRNESLGGHGVVSLTISPP